MTLFFSSNSLVEMLLCVYNNNNEEKTTVCCGFGGETFLLTSIPIIKNSSSTPPWDGIIEFLSPHLLSYKQTLEALSLISAARPHQHQGLFPHVVTSLEMLTPHQPARPKETLPSSIWVFACPASAPPHPFTRRCPRRLALQALRLQQNGNSAGPS